jgi:ribosome-binding factor A
MQSNNTSTRQYRVGEIIRRALISVLSSGKIFDPSLTDISITVSEVRVSPDLKVARVYVLPLQNNIDKIAFMKTMKNLSPTFRRLVTSEVSLKYSPELIFNFDDSFDRVAEIDNILRDTLIDA